MPFRGYLNKIGLGSQEKRKDSEIPHRRGIQLTSGSQTHSPPPSIIGNTDLDSIISSMDASEDMDGGSGNSRIDSLESLADDGGIEINDGAVYDEEEEDDGDPSTNPEYPCKFGPDDTFDEERLMNEEHWSRGQLDLWYKIRARGSYPLFPAHWMLDFSNLPDELFVEQGAEPIIGARNRKGEVRGILAFDALMQLGSRVRDKWESGMFNEKWLGKELGKYVEWAMRDGEIRMIPYLPRIEFLGNMRANADLWEDVASTYTGVFAISGAPIFETCERRMSKVRFVWSLCPHPTLANTLLSACQSSPSDTAPPSKPHVNSTPPAGAPSSPAT